MKKLTYLDFAKGVCMLLIIFGHIFPYPDHPVLVYAYSFHVPAFFIISGILMEHTKEYNRPFLTLARNNILRLLVPYLSFETIYNVVYCIFNGFGNMGWLMWQTITLYGAGLATWFLPVLFAAKAYLLLLRKATSNQIVVGIACLIPFCIAHLSGFDDSTGLWKLYIVFRTCNAIGLLWIGTLLHKHLDRITSSTAVLTLCLTVSVAAGIGNGRVSNYSMLYRNSLLYIAAAVAGTRLLICIGSRIKSVEPISFFSKNSVIVLGTHQQVQYIITRIFGESVVSANWLPLMLPIILSQYPIAYLINRFAPFLLGKWYRR